MISKKIGKTKIFIFLSAMATFINLIHLSTGACTAKTDCLPANPNVKLPIEIGIIYDLGEDQAAKQPFINLNDAACEAISQFKDGIVLKRYPGASVVDNGNDIQCKDDCFRLREDACKAIVEPNYSSTCAKRISILMIPLTECVDQKKSDGVLKNNGALRCSAGIPENKIPALMFNKEYDPCHDFTSADQIKAFLCTTYGKALKGC